MKYLPLLFLWIFALSLLQADEPSNLGISTDPESFSFQIGTGNLGNSLFKLKPSAPLRIGGFWTFDGDYVFAGGAKGKNVSGNNLLILSALFDTEKASLWNNGLVGAEFLQFNGMPSYEQAGSVQDFDSLTALSPWNRTELYQLWIRQAFFDQKFSIRVGKMIGSIDFNNIQRPLPFVHKSPNIPAISSLLYLPVFLNPITLGVMPAYYDPAYGAIMRVAPIPRLYLSAGAFDGNFANKVRTGLTGPHFNGHYFYIAETGFAWGLDPLEKEGIIALGGWDQTGKLSIPGSVKEKGAQGIYLFGSQRLWMRHPGKDFSGVSVFWQLGKNNSKVLPMNDSFGCGCTAFALTGPQDSFGLGATWSKLNRNIFSRNSELMLQGYYQAHLFFQTFIKPVITFIPTPGSGKHLPPTWVFSVQVLSLL